jgi:hypothetical protein
MRQHEPVHTTGLRADEFELEIAGQPASVEALFDGFDEHDRLGIVIARDDGAAGAAALILATVTAFYDRLRATGKPFFAYPDYFALHVGRARGSLSQLDVYPDHKEVVVPADLELIVRALNDRGITRLLVPDHAGRAADHAAGASGLARETQASAQRLIRTALAYSPDGRPAGADVHVTGPERAEAFVTAMLAGGDPAGEDSHVRDVLRGAGRPPREGFRRIGVADALAMLAGIADPEAHRVTTSPTAG